MKQIAIVGEDKLTMALLRKCVSTYIPDFHVVRAVVTNGRGNVKKEIAAYAMLAKKMPVLIGIDLDDDECAPSLREDWAEMYEEVANLLIRVAVAEAEAWVLADRKRCAQFLGATSDEIAANPETLVDPKRALLDLARANADTDLKRDLIPRNYNQFDLPRIGPAYNLRMTNFVATKWRPHVARARSDSLDRAIICLEKL
ncbi:hypothetical protein [Actimicrobium sp. GrIS 1.19]|uniref:hypothetical protein n=1 Tax=Actimicrobium sp. GrIS 1.19 TaxID=3071708 RepID=UPI002E140555